MKQPKISVITICLNSEKTIERTINSLVNQSYKNFEYIIIDGGSTDETIQIIKRYQQSISEFPIYWISEKDTGYADAWNKGLNKSNGEIIGLLNSDDYYENNTLEIIYNLFDKNPFVISYGKCFFVDKYNYTIKVNNLNFNPHKIYYGFGFMHTTCFTTKKVYDKIGQFNTNLKYCADTEFLLRAHINNINFVKADNITYMGIGGISDKNRLKAYKEYTNQLRKNGYKSIKVLYHKYIYITKHYLKKILSTTYIKRFIIQLFHIGVSLINLIYNLTPFFYFKRIFLIILRMRIGKKSYIHSPVNFFCFGNFMMGDNSVINRGCYLDNRKGIVIGDNVSIGHNTKIYSLGHDIDDPLFRNKGKEVTIKNFVSIFTNVLIMPGVTINEGAVVLSGSVVTKDVAPHTVVGGNPAKFIRNRNRELKYKLDHGYWFAL